MTFPNCARLLTVRSRESQPTPPHDMISFTDLSDGAPPEPLWLVRVCINDRDKDTAAVFATHGGLWRCVRAKDAPNSVAAMMAAKATAGRVPGGLFARWIRMRREDAPIGMAVAVLADKVITGAREGARYAIKGDSVIATVEPSDLYPVQFRIRALKRVTDDTIKGGVDQ